MPTAVISTQADPRPLPVGELCIALPQDKSILHRIVFVAAISTSVVSVPLMGPLGADVKSSITALRSLGVRIEEEYDSLTIYGVGPNGFRNASTQIDCGNSGTTARLLMGVLSAQSFESVLVGDASLSRRPMARLASILADQLGARIECSESGTLPIRITGLPLHGAQVALPVASAQMKTAILLAGLASGAGVVVSELAVSRDHTERMLVAFGCDLSLDGNSSELRATADTVLPQDWVYSVPGDISAAAFFVVAAAILRIDIRMESVGLNPTRTAYLDVLSDAGVPIWFSDVSEIHGERRGTIHVGGSRIPVLRALHIDRETIASLVDEIPALAVFAMFATGTSRITDASELRVKESDRIAAIAENLQRFGVTVRESADGLEIDGREDDVLGKVVIESAGDHRIAMAMAVAALRVRGVVTIPDTSVVSISFPAFYDQLSGVAAAAGTTITIARTQ